MYDIWQCYQQLHSQLCLRLLFWYSATAFEQQYLLFCVACSFVLIRSQQGNQTATNGLSTLQCTLPMVPWMLSQALYLHSQSPVSQVLGCRNLPVITWSWTKSPSWWWLPSWQADRRSSCVLNRMTTFLVQRLVADKPIWDHPQILCILWLK